MGASGLNITPSALIVCNKFAALSVPMGSPTPTTPAESVDSNRLSVSVLINTSLHGQTPSAPARRDVYKKVFHWLLEKRSPLTRIVVRLLYRLLCRKWRGRAIQYCIVRLCCAIALAILFIKAGGSLRFVAGNAFPESQSCSYVIALPPCK